MLRERDTKCALNMLHENLCWLMLVDYVRGLETLPCHECSDCLFSNKMNLLDERISGVTSCSVLKMDVPSLACTDVTCLKQLNLLHIQVGMF